MGTSRAFLPLIAACAAVCLARGANAIERVHDDRVVVKRVLATSERLSRLLPVARAVLTIPDAFTNKDLIDSMADMRDVAATFRGSLQLTGTRADVKKLRSEANDAVKKFIHRTTVYRSMYLSVGRRAEALVAIGKRMPENPQTKEQVALHNKLAARYNAHVKTINPRIEELNKLFFEFFTAYRDMVETLNRMQKELAPLYKSGEIKPQPLAAAPTRIDLGQPAGAGEEAPAKGGGTALKSPGTPGTPGAGGPAPPTPGTAGRPRRSRRRTKESKCTPREFHRAVRNKDLEFLDELAGKLVTWKATLLEPVEEEVDDEDEDEGRLLASLVAGGRIAAEFPLKTDAEAFEPGAALKVKGSLRQEEDGDWILRVVQWGLVSELDEGGKMTRCRWPRQRR